MTTIGDRHDKKVTEWSDSLVSNLDSRVYIIDFFCDVNTMMISHVESAGDTYT